MNLIAVQALLPSGIVRQLLKKKGGGFFPVFSAMSSVFKRSFFKKFGNYFPFILFHLKGKFFGCLTEFIHNLSM